MIYLFYGIKDFLINKELKKIEDSFDKININKFDLSNSKIEELIEECETISMFSDKKLVIAENANIFTSSGSLDIEKLEKYLNNPNPSTTLVFIVNAEKLDERKIIVKLIRKTANIKEFNTDTDIKKFIKSELKDYQITPESINLFIERVGEDERLIQNEINKLKLYKSDKIITNDDIINLTHKNVNTDIFKLIEYIINEKKDEALEMYYEMINQNEEPIKIIVMLANQFRIMYQVKELYSTGYTEKEIAAKLKIHPYRVKLANQNSKRFKSETLLKYLKKLSDIDYNIKSGKIDKNLALELFILKK